MGIGQRVARAEIRNSVHRVTQLKLSVHLFLCNDSVMDQHAISPISLTRFNALGGYARQPADRMVVGLKS